MLKVLTYVECTYFCTHYIFLIGIRNVLSLETNQIILSFLPLYFHRRSLQFFADFLSVPFVTNEKDAKTIEVCDNHPKTNAFDF